MRSLPLPPQTHVHCRFPRHPSRSCVCVGEATRRASISRPASTPSTLFFSSGYLSFSLFGYVSLRLFFFFFSFFSFLETNLFFSSLPFRPPLHPLVSAVASSLQCPPVSSIPFTRSGRFTLPSFLLTLLRIISSIYSFLFILPATTIPRNLNTPCPRLRS